jgi:hypothetical protein
MELGYLIQYSEYASGWTTNVWGLKSRQGKSFFFSFPQLPDRLCSVIIVGVSQGVQRPGYEDGHTFPSGVDVKKDWNYTSLPLAFLWRGA